MEAIKKQIIVLNKGVESKTIQYVKSEQGNSNSVLPNRLIVNIMLFDLDIVTQ